MKQLILDFNTMWGTSLATPGLTLPADWHITQDRRHLQEAAAVVFHVPSLTEIPTVKPRGQLWVAWSMEAAANYPLLTTPDFMRVFDLTMTYRLDSNIAVPYSCYYGSPAQFRSSLRKPPPPKNRDRLALLFVSSPHNKSGRFEFVSELMRHMPVHSYGKQLNNRVLENDLGHASKIELAGSYHFTLALENAVDEDYVTEKFFDPLVAGSVPVYLGASNVERFAPGEHCFINVNHFSSPKALADELLALATNEIDYANYHAWRNRPLREEFLDWLTPQEISAQQRLVHAVIAANASTQLP